MLKSVSESHYSGTTVEALILPSQGMGHVRARHTELNPILQVDLGQRGVSVGMRAPRIPDNQSDARRLESGRGDK